MGFGRHGCRAGAGLLHDFPPEQPLPKKKFVAVAEDEAAESDSGTPLSGMCSKLAPDLTKLMLHCSTHSDEIVALVQSLDSSAATLQCQPPAKDCSCSMQILWDCFVPSWVLDVLSSRPESLTSYSPLLKLRCLGTLHRWGGVVGVRRRAGKQASTA